MFEGPGKVEGSANEFESISDSDLRDMYYAEQNKQRRTIQGRDINSSFTNSPQWDEKYAKSIESKFVNLNKMGQELDRRGIKMPTIEEREKASEELFKSFEDGDNK